MEKSQFTDEQIIGILHKAERGQTSIAAICRDAGITQTTFYRWRKRFGGMNVSEARRLRELEKENTQLKRLLAQRDLEVDVIKELLSKKGEALLKSGRVRP